MMIINITINITINVALLTNVKKQKQNSRNGQSIGMRLTKTKAITAIMAAYLPTLVFVNILGYAVMNSTDKEILHNMVIFFYLAMIPTQLNAVLNSVIYLARNSDIKRYYLNLFNCGKADKKITKYCVSGARCESKSTGTGKFLFLIKAK